MSDYAHPEALVSTGWVAERTNDPKVKIVEVDVEPTKGYDVGHIKNAIGWNWTTDLCDTTIRDLIDPKAFAKLASAAKALGSIRSRIVVSHKSVVQFQPIAFFTWPTS